MCSSDLLAPGTTPEAFAAARHTELGDFVDGDFAVAHVGEDSIELVRHGHAAGVAAVVRKRLSFRGDRSAPGIALEVRFANVGSGPIEGRLAIEWGVNLLGGGGNPSAWIEPHEGSRVRFDGDGSVAGVTRFAMGNDWIGAEIRSAIAPAADAWWSSIDTVSNSEGGFERTHQGCALLVSWPVALDPGEELVVGIDQAVAIAKDRAADEP